MKCSWCEGEGVNKVRDIYEICFVCKGYGEDLRKKRPKGDGPEILRKQEGGEQ